MDFREEGVTDDHLLALAETLLEMPLVSSLDLRDNYITDRVRTPPVGIIVELTIVVVSKQQGVRGLLELMRHQLVLVKGAPGSPSSTTASSLFHDTVRSPTRPRPQSDPSWNVHRHNA